MITEWKYMAQIITTNKAAGTQLAVLAAKFPGDPNSEAGTFEGVTQLSPQAWAVETPCTQAFVDVIDTLMADASIDDPRLAYLKDRGLTASLWGQAKQIIKAGWYQTWQEDGSYTLNPNALSDFIAAQGYVVVEP